MTGADETRGAVVTNVSCAAIMFRILTNDAGDIAQGCF
jgi:hypothetical protein